MVEAMEIVEMYCDLVLARFGLVTQMKELDEGLSEAISSLIWVAPRMHTDVQVGIIVIIYFFSIILKFNTCKIIFIVKTVIC